MPDRVFLDTNIFVYSFAPEAREKQAAALSAGCKALMSEDLQDGRVGRGLRIDNPFA